MKSLSTVPGVATIHADQCQFGAVASRGPSAGQPLKKPIGFMSNEPEVLKNLDRRCEGRGGECSCPSGGRHAPCTGSVCRDAARYPNSFCQAVPSGLMSQLGSDGRIEQGCYGVQIAEEVNALTNDRWQGMGPGYSGKYRDDLTGQSLRDDLVKAARKKEL